MRRTLNLAMVAIACSFWAVAFVLDSFSIALAAATATAVALGLLIAPESISEIPLASGDTVAVHAVETIPDEPIQPRVSAASSPEPASSPHREISAPTSLEPRSVVRALLDNARVYGEALSAHLWLLDPTTGTLRLVAADGPTAPSGSPMQASDPVLGRAIEEGTVIAEEINRVTTPRSGTSVITRVAFPVMTTDLRGVAGIDFAHEVPPGDSVTELGVAMRLPLASALALYSARTRTREAVGLIEAARDLSRALHPERVLEIALERAMRLSGAATGSIMLLDEDRKTLTIARAEGLPQDIVDSTVVAVGEGIAGWVAASGQPVLVEDLPGKKPGAQRHGVRSAVSVPIADDEQLLGVLNVGSRTFPARFTQDHLDTLEMLGRQTGVALRNANAVTSASEIYYDTLKTLALALETKDPYASGGTERVVHYSEMLCDAMELEPAEKRAVQIAAMLHDIGMSALGPVGADCSRPLSTMERGLLKMHPVIASDILDQAPALKAVAPIVYHHHEHFDGSGYVSGISGTDIPLGARILSVADAYVAMTSDRPYRCALTPRKAAEELADKAGTQFDPDVVRAFLVLLRSETNRVPQSSE